MAAKALPAYWTKLLRRVPGYDPIATRGHCTFDDKEARRRLAFFPDYLKHVKGEKGHEAFTLEPWEQAFIANLFGWKRPDGTRRYRECFLFIPRKNGKRLALNTPLPTPTGWTTMGDVQVGDKVFSEDGEPIRVVYCSEVDDSEPCYRLDFSDGTSIVAGESHLWMAQSYVERANKKPARLYTTGEMWKHPLSSDGRAVFRIRRAKALNLPDVPLPIDPYAMGFWIGNGNAKKGDITIHRADVETVQTFFPYEASKHRQQAGYSDTLLFPELRQKLRDLGLLGAYHDKHIPQPFLRASQGQRWALLQGLMDSDGCISQSGQGIYVTIIKQLAEDVCALLMSLGIPATVNTVHSHRYGKPNKACYRVLFTAFDDMPVSRLGRKLLHRKQRKSVVRSEYVYIKKITPVAPVMTKCIAVDSPSHLYLAGDGMIPTHNTSIAAGVVLSVLFQDDEPGMECYSAAADRDQASLVFSQAEGMILQAPELAAHCQIYKTARSVVREDRASSYKVISADAASKHGFNSQFVVIDELHAQPNRELVDVLMTSTGSRKQPLMLHVTTSDFDRPSICNEKYDYACKVRDGIIEDQGFLPIIYEAPKVWEGETCDYTNPKFYANPAIWKHANPNLGVSLSKEYMERECKRAQETPSYLNTFLRLHLNVKTAQDVAWLDMTQWDACYDETITTDELMGQRCWAGLDLASTSDLCALVLVFPDAGNAVLPFFWLPSETALIRERRSRVPYPAWVQQGFIRTTAGNVTDYDVIREDILELAERYDIQELAIDRWNSSQLQTQLGSAGLEIVPFGQGFASMAAPSKELERLILARELRHDGHPVLRWNISNVMIETDAAANVKPSKKKSSEKIDGVVALIMALGRAIVRPEDAGSVYDSRGILTI